MVVGLRRASQCPAVISTEYYSRLEQGRDRNPSMQVLEAIARVLRLDDEMSPLPAEPCGREAAEWPPRSAQGDGADKSCSTRRIPAEMDDPRFSDRNQPHLC
jgi:transcriptional regulator with XRE-family HTH domain